MKNSIKMADKALAKSGADAKISEDGTVSGSPQKYFKFLDAFIPEDAANDPIDDLIKILARQDARDYAAVKVEGLSYWAAFITPEEETEFIAQIFFGVMQGSMPFSRRASRNQSASYPLSASSTLALGKALSKCLAPL